MGGAGFALQTRRPSAFAGWLPPFLCRTEGGGGSSIPVTGFCLSVFGSRSAAAPGCQTLRQPFPVITPPAARSRRRLAAEPSAAAPVPSAPMQIRKALGLTGGLGLGLSWAGARGERRDALGLSAVAGGGRAGERAAGAAAGFIHCLSRAGGERCCPLSRWC